MSQPWIKINYLPDSNNSLTMGGIYSPGDVSGFTMWALCGSSPTGPWTGLEVSANSDGIWTAKFQFLQTTPHFVVYMLPKGVMASYSGISYVPQVGVDGVVAVTEVVSDEPSLVTRTVPSTTGGMMTGLVKGLPQPAGSVIALYYQNSQSGDWTLAYDTPVLPDRSFFGRFQQAASAYAGILFGPGVEHPATCASLPTGGLAEVQVTAHAVPAPQAVVVPHFYGLEAANFATNSGYDLGTEDFTVELWVGTTQAGTLLSFATLFTTSNGSQAFPTLMLSVQTGGAVLFGIAGQPTPGSEPPPGTCTQPAAVWLTDATNILDGSWHHVAATRRGDRMSVLVDAEEVAGTMTTAQNATPSQISLGLLNKVCLGWSQFQETSLIQSNSSLKPTDYLFLGYMDELRIWSVAREPRETRALLYSNATGQEKGLLGCWHFDGNTNDATKGGHNMFENAGGQPSFTADVVGQAPVDQPYLVVQCKLMQDYQVTSSSSAAEEIISYRVTISVRTAEHMPLPTSLQFTSQVPITIYSGLDTYDIDLGTPANVQTTPGGEYSFYMPAQYLAAPLIKVSAAFMAPGEGLLISPDRHCHYALTNLTSAQMQAMKGSSCSTQLADAVGSAVQSLMSCCLPHDVQSNHPDLRPVDQAYDTFVPVTRPRLYENPAVTRLPYDPKSDVCTCYVHEGAFSKQNGVVRVVETQDMQCSNWILNVENGSFHACSASELDSHLQGLNLQWAPGQPIETAGASGANGPTAEQNAAFQTVLNSRGQAVDQATMAMALSFNFSARFDQAVAWVKEQVSSAKEVVVSAVEVLMKDGALGGSKITTVAMVMVQGENQAEGVLVNLTDFAIGATAGILEVAGAAVTAVLSEVQSLFGWNDIVLTQQVLDWTISEAIPASKELIKKSLTNVQKQIQTFKQQVDEYMQKAQQKLSGYTMAEGTEQTSGVEPASTQGGYMQRMTAAYADSPGGTVNLPADLDVSALQGLVESLHGISDSKGKSFAASLEQAGLTTMLSNPRELMRAGLSALIGVVRAVLDAAFDFATIALEAVKKVVDAMFSFVKQFLNGEIDLPVVTAIFKKVTGQSKMTMASILSLAGGAAATLAWKLTHDNQAPFTQQEVNAITEFQLVDWLETNRPQANAMEAQSTNDRLVVASFSMTAFSIVTSAIAGGLACVMDLPTRVGEPGAVLTGLKLSAETIAWLLATPLAFLAQPNWSGVVAGSISVFLWGITGLACLGDWVSIFSYMGGLVGPIAARIPSVVSKNVSNLLKVVTEVIMPIVACVVGILYMAGTIVMAVFHGMSIAKAGLSEKQLTANEAVWFFELALNLVIGLGGAVQILRLNPAWKKGLVVAEGVITAVAALLAMIAMAPNASANWARPPVEQATLASAMA